MADLPSMRTAFDTAKAAAFPLLPQDSWYIIAAATLLSAGGSKSFGQLYKYTLADLDPDATLEERQRLLTRLREILVKSWVLVGVPSVIEAWYSLRGIAEPKDLINNESRQKLAASPDIRLARAQKWFKQVFDEEEDKIFGSFATFPELEWTLKDVIYGTFLSDLSILDPLENEMVVLACVAGQGADSPVLSHYKGLRRVGASAAEAELVGQVIEIVAKGLGVDTSNWHTSREVEGYFE